MGYNPLWWAHFNENWWLEIQFQNLWGHLSIIIPLSEACYAEIHDIPGCSGMGGVQSAILYKYTLFDNCRQIFTYQRTLSKIFHQISKLISPLWNKYWKLPTQHWCGIFMVFLWTRYLFHDIMPISQQCVWDNIFTIIIWKITEAWSKIKTIQVWWKK